MEALLLERDELDAIDDGDDGIVSFPLILRLSLAASMIQAHPQPCPQP